MGSGTDYRDVSVSQWRYLLHWGCRLTEAPNWRLLYRPSTPSGILMSKAMTTLAMIILISLAAKNLPGQAWRPTPNCINVSHILRLRRSMRSVNETYGHHVGVDRNKLIDGSGLHFTSRASLLTKTRKSPRVKVVGVREDVGIVANSPRRDFNDNAGRDELAVRQGERFVDLALERGGSARV